MRRLALLIAIVFAVTGCTFTLVGNAPKTEKSVAQTKTVNSTFVKSEQFINACPGEGQQLSEIRFHTNPVYLLASLVTFGLYVPQNVTWWCSAEEAECAQGDESGDCEPYVPAEN